MSIHLPTQNYPSAVLRHFTIPSTFDPHELPGRRRIRHVYCVRIIFMRALRSDSSGRTGQGRASVQVACGIAAACRLAKRRSHARRAARSDLDDTGFILPVPCRRQMQDAVRETLNHKR